jgi:trigger factor
VEAEIKEMLYRQGKFNPVTDREIRTGDTAVIDLTDESEEGAEAKRQVVRVGDNLPDFDAGLQGMKLEEEKSIPVTYPEDHQAEELRGKSADLKVKLIELFERELPELTDEWVKTTFAPQPEEGAEVPEDAVDTVDKLKAKIREAMEKAAQDVADRDVRDKLIEKIIESSKIDFPQVMVDEQIDDRVSQLAEELKSRKITVDDYLKHVGKTMEELRGEFAEDAKTGLKVNLVIHDIIDKEGIKVEDEDIDAEIQSMSDTRKVPVESIKAYLESTDGMTQLRYRLLRKKAMDFLVDASNIKNVG